MNSSYPKKLLFSIVFFSASFVIAQDYNYRTVNKMVVFPGCEDIDSNSKSKLQLCLQQKLTESLSQELSYFSDYMEESGMPTAFVKVRFIITREGKIKNINAVKGGTPELGKAAEKALTKIALELPPIQPATLTDGAKVNLIFELPIRYVLNEEEESNSLFDNYSERVVATLKSKIEVYEIRAKLKTNKYRAYEISTGKNVFLGEFQTIGELFSAEPYQTLLEEMLVTNKLLITEAYIEGELYRFYEQEKEKDKILCYKVENDEEIFEKEISWGEFLENPKYTELIMK